MRLLGRPPLMGTWGDGMLRMWRIYPTCSLGRPPSTRASRDEYVIHVRLYFLLILPPSTMIRVYQHVKMSSKQHIPIVDYWVVLI